MAVPSPAMTVTIRPTRSELRIAPIFLRSFSPAAWPAACRRLAFHRWYEATPMTNAPPARKAAVMVWKNCVSVVFWVRTRQMSVSCALPVDLSIV